ncbi:MAG: DUF1565 domain-containing protein [Hormoscilla sp.]
MKRKLLTSKQRMIALTLSSVLGLGAILWVVPKLKAQGLPPDRETIAQQRTIFVDPDRGSDRSGAGQSEYQAFRTITYAISQATPGTVIQLAPGRYGREETFPIKLPDRVSLRGDESRQGAGIEIVGGGLHVNPFWAAQNITIRPGENSQILGVTVTNPNTRGTGIWIETDATVRNNTLKNNNRDGIAIVNTANPTIENNRFLDNAGNGMFISNQARGQIRNNLFENTGYGLAIDQKADTLVEGNKIANNRSGIVITRWASPQIIRNRIEYNKDYSIVAIGQSRPTLEQNTIFGNGSDEVVMSVPTNPEPTVAANAPTTQFECLQSGNDFVIGLRQGENSLPRIMFPWTQKIQQWASASTCQTATQSLNNIVVENGRNFNGLNLRPGLNGTKPVVCLVSQSQRSCNSNNIIFNASPQGVIGQITDIFGGGTNGLEQQLETFNLRDLDKPWQMEPGLWFMDK